jgi:hypothetical protein
MLTFHSFRSAGYSATQARRFMKEKKVTFHYCVGNSSLNLGHFYSLSLSLGMNFDSLGVNTLYLLEEPRWGTSAFFLRGQFLPWGANIAPGDPIKNLPHWWLNKRRCYWGSLNYNWGKWKRSFCLYRTASKKPGGNCKSSRQRFKYAD